MGNSLLDLVKQTAGTEEEYLDAFFAVNAQLKSAQDAAGAQVSAADKQLEALQGQLDVQNAALKQLQGQSATLEEIEKQIADLKPLLDAAGQKAGVKAFARGGLAMPGWSLVGEEGPELVNFSQPGRVYTAADTAALFRSVTPRGLTPIQEAAKSGVAAGKSTFARTCSFPCRDRQIFPPHVRHGGSVGRRGDAGGAGMKLIEPQAIRLLSSTVPENDAPAWDADTAYEIGDSVIHEHRVYKAVADSTGKQPDQHSEGTDAAWRLMGPTNRYAMLDQYVSTQTVAAEDVMTFTVTFNRCTAFALLNFKATSIRAEVRDGDGLVMYDRTVNTLKDVDGYWNYYFLPLERIVDQAVTNIPMSPVATLYVSLTQEGGPALGQVIAGQSWPIGTTQYNTRLGIRDYSRKDTDEFGNTRLVKRANAKRTSLPLYLHPSRLDSVREILARMHGLPALWLGDDNEGIGSYQSLTVWGWLEDWNATVIGPNEVSMNIDVQGLK